MKCQSQLTSDKTNHSGMVNILLTSNDMDFGHIDWHNCSLYSQNSLCFCPVVIIVCFRMIHRSMSATELWKIYSRSPNSYKNLNYFHKTKNYLRRTSTNDCPERMSIVQWLHSEQHRAWARLTWSTFRSYFDWAVHQLRKLPRTKMNRVCHRWNVKINCKNKLFVNKIYGSLFYEYCISVLLHVIILYFL